MEANPPTAADYAQAAADSAKERVKKLEDRMNSDTVVGVPLRDYFAAQALIGILAYGGMTTGSDRATDAYRYADAMMAARKR